MPDEHSTPNPKRAHRFRRWVILLLCAILAAYIGWRIYDGRVREYRLVALMPCNGWYSTAAKAGFLLDSGPSLVFYDWHGRKCWRVDRKREAGGAYPMYNLSSDGHTLGMTVSEKNGVSLQQWRDGKRLGTVLLPSSIWNTPGEYPNSEIGNTDDGRTFFWYTKKRSINLIVMKGGRVIARGAVTSPHVPANPRAVVAPDMSCMLVYSSPPFSFGGLMNLTPIGYSGADDRHDTSYFSLKNEKGVIRATYRFTARMTFPIVFRKEQVLTSTGKVFTPSGAVTSIKGIMKFEYPEIGVFDSCITQHRPGSSHTTIMKPDPSDAWRCPLRVDKPGTDNEYSVYALTPEGKYALFYIVDTARFAPPSFPPPVERIFINTPILRDYLRGRKLSSCLALIRRPGRLQAVLRLTKSSDYSQYWQHDGQRYLIEPDDFFGSRKLSPDGRALAMVVYKENRSNPSSAQEPYLALFRW